MVSKVGIVTDSTAYIPQEIMQKYSIRTAPAVVIWDGEEYYDGVDLQPSDFYKRLEHSESLPTTSQPSPAAVKKAVEELLAEGHEEILGVFISEKLSGTVASARQAKDLMGDIKMEVVDSTLASMAAGWPIIKAAEAAAGGANLAECKAIVEEARKNAGVLLTVETLEFLHRGGRMSNAKWLIGSVLSIKPILEVQNGVLELLESVRTHKKSMKRLVELVEKRVDNRSPVYMAAIHANAPDSADEIMAMIKEVMDIKETVISEVSPAIGTHTGPGTIGLCYMAG